MSVLSFLLTACTSTGIHFLTLQPAASPNVVRLQTETTTSAPSPPVVSPRAAESPGANYSRIAQEAVVTFPRVGQVRVRAYEEFRNLRLEFAGISGREILSVYLGRSDWNWSKQGPDDWNPKLRFKVLSVKGLPDPLVVGVAMCPGVSDSAWEAVAVGVVNGELDRLTYESVETSNQGGFFFGDLGRGMGFGAAQWDFVWGEDEGHIGPHKYEVKLYKWDGRRFEWEKVIRTRKLFESPQAALRSEGFHYVDIRDAFPDWGIDDLW